MEIERKFLIERQHIPDNLSEYPHDDLEQAYIITEPVLRIRRKNDTYILTYKGQGLMKREEAEFPLTASAYKRLLTKTEGSTISKTRYNLPEKNRLTIELDCFHGALEGLYLAEVEFPDEETAFAYLPPAWFGKEVTSDIRFHNSSLSQMTDNEMVSLVASL